MKKHRHHKRRHSKHNRPRFTKPRSNWLSMRSRARFLPAIVITLVASLLWAQPHLAFLQRDNGVLAYATNVSISGLLSSTNSKRQANGRASLGLDSRLNSAAQAKANDMVNRDYWSHVTPDGQQPWVFITNAGYQYLSAGENLAYGFMTSTGTVNGWMNSPSHKANLLSSTFTEVGFGIANSANYVGNGNQTVVVAMYGKPQVASNPAPKPKPTPPKPTPTTPQPKPETKPAQDTKTQTEEKQEPAEEPEEKAEDEDSEPIAILTSDEQAPPTATTTKVQRIQVMTGGSAIWSATFVILGVCAIGLLWAVHRGFRLKKWLSSTEKLVGKHLHLDLTVLSIIYLGFVLLSTTGTIK